MFVKFHNPAAPREKAVPAAPRRSTISGPPSSIPSIIGQGLTFEGHVTGEGDLHVEGELLGDVTISHLSIGETGCVKGKIIAASVDVRGAVFGSITAKIVRLVATARVEGDITHDQLEVEKGASFEGRCTKLRATPPEGGQKAVEETFPSDNVVAHPEPLGPKHQDDLDALQPALPA